MSKKATLPKQAKQTVKAVKPAEPAKTPTKRSMFHPRSWWLGAAELLVLLFVVGIFTLKVSNYYGFENFQLGHLVGDIRTGSSDAVESLHENRLIGSCPAPTHKVTHGWTYECRMNTAPGPYVAMFDTLPKNAKNHAYLYDSVANGNTDSAKLLLKNQYELAGLKPVTIAQNTWKENPYQNETWQEAYYNLSSVNDLVAEFTSTHKLAYATQATKIVDSFTTKGAQVSDAWTNNAVVAQRSMALTNYWWQLRQRNVLPIATSNAVLTLLDRQSTFLADSTHYDSANTSGVDESAALLLVGADFPAMPGASSWRQLATTRLNDGAQLLVQNDGVLVANSPAQELALLAKYWGVYNFAGNHHITLASTFKSRVQAMVQYATYIIRPDDSVPIVGRSTQVAVTTKGELGGVLTHFPQLAYSISHGKAGTRPAQTSKQFADSGQTIMRSSWSSRSFADQTQLLFQYGATSTQHNHLDALSMILYGGGSALLPGAITPNSASPAVTQYFSGTASHNTVLVDHDNQISGGQPQAGSFVNGQGFVSQSAADNLNLGVTHERQVVMVGQNDVVVIDQLHSQSQHTYQQLFHLFPGAKYSANGLTATATDAAGHQRLTITQLNTDGLQLSDTYGSTTTGNVGGLCSVQVNVVTPCHQLAYTAMGTNATFVTLLHLGAGQPLAHTLDQANQLLTLNDGSRQYAISLEETTPKAISAKASDTKSPVAQLTTIDDLSRLGNWQTVDGTLKPSTDTYAPGAPAARLTTHDDQLAITTHPVHLDLSSADLVVHLKMPDVSNVKAADLVVYNDDNNYAIESLQAAYAVLSDSDPGLYTTSNESQLTSEWQAVSLGKGSERTSGGQWQIHGSFDWSKITSIGFKLETNSATPVDMLLGAIDTQPAQPKSNVLFVFDDGSSSILPAAQALEQYGYPANVAVIGKYSSNVTNGYLTVPQLRSLQTAGWSMINHSYYHQDALQAYYYTHHLDAYRDDILQGANFLENNGLDSDPNWFIYPHGAANATTEAIVGQYYKFARGELSAPEVFPFGNPYKVKSFLVNDTTSPASVEAAITDAQKYNLTLLLTFHRIKANAKDQSGYDLGNFQTILQYMRQNKVTPLSFNQLDAANGVSINHLQIASGSLPQLGAHVSSYVGANQASGICVGSFRLGSATLYQSCETE